MPIGNSPSLYSALGMLLSILIPTVTSQAHRIVASFVSWNRARGGCVEQPNCTRVGLSAEDTRAARAVKESHVQAEEMQLFKELYYRLQNLECYPEILPQSRDLLISVLSETLLTACLEPASGILSVADYTPQGLTDFMRKRDEAILQQWEYYLARRKAGSSRELFTDAQHARHWLKQNAPVKYVDGAWLGHVNKITTPFSLRRTSKNAWQVLSEELGDGELKKNHAHVYRELMKEISAELPAGDCADFIHPRHHLNEASVWKAAVAQLLISLFPHEFFPEILGFNMNFEALTMETLLAAKELEELKLNAYYFILHISIDNADSGHTAMAIQAVMDYVEQLQEAHGTDAAHQAWKRVQAGFLLCEGLSKAQDRLPRKSHPPFYWSFVGREERPSHQVFQNQDIRADYPVFSLPSTETLPPPQRSRSDLSLPLIPGPIFNFTTTTTSMPTLIPLWFAHPCLLELFSCIPFKTTTKTGCAVINLLRAQYGFNMGGPGVDGMDEVRRTDSVDLVAIGLELTERGGFAKPGSLREVLTNWPSEFATTMLHLSMRPVANAPLLLGLTWAFVALHEALASSGLLSAAGADSLRRIARRERDCLMVCIDELRHDELACTRFREGCCMGQEAIEGCFL